MQPVGKRGGVDYLKELLAKRYTTTETFVWRNGTKLLSVNAEEEVFRYACFLSKEKLANGEPILAARIALTVAHRYPPALIPLAKAELILQLQSFARWEEKYGRGDVGVRLLEWAIRIQKALGDDSRELHALQLLYLPNAEQGNFLAARDEFLAIGQKDRAKQATSKLRAFTPARPNHNLPSIEPLCALKEHAWLTTPL